MSTGSFAAGLVGVVLDGRYRLDALLGEGGMGAVYRAQHLAMDRKVAVKLLKPHLTQDHAAAQRFLREARATLKVDSPHAVKVLDFGITPHGDYYMALEYLDGRTVQRELDVDGPFSPERTLHIARHALHALAAAHRSGLVHRDIKPDNILLMRVADDPDYAKLLDFGVAKLMEGTATSDKSRMALTAAGMVFGTPEFMSPEQACGHQLDGRSDLYSLAATMFAMLTGCGLFEGKSAIEWLTHHARTPPPHLAMLRPELAKFPDLDALLQRCLAKRREYRPRSAEELDRLLAELELYVQRGGSTGATPAAGGNDETAPRTPNALKSSLQSPSAYIAALPPDTVDPGETLLPPSRDSEPGHSLSKAPTLPPPGTGEVPAVPRRGGLYLALGALVVVGVIGLAIGASMRKRSSRTASIPADASRVANRTEPLDAGVALDAAILVDAAPVAIVIDAGVPRRDAGMHRPGPDARVPRNTEAQQHLAAAEAALRTDNRLGQLAAADLALKADPRNVRAKYLLADALIKGGDLDRGCAYLRALGRNPVAIARANAAKCPTD